MKIVFQFIFLYKYSLVILIARPFSSLYIKIPQFPLFISTRILITSDNRLRSPDLHLQPLPNIPYWLSCHTRVIFRGQRDPLRCARADPSVGGPFCRNDLWIRAWVWSVPSFHRGWWIEREGHNGSRFQVAALMKRYAFRKGDGGIELLLCFWWRWLVVTQWRGTGVRVVLKLFDLLEIYCKSLFVSFWMWLSD